MMNNTNLSESAEKGKAPVKENPQQIWDEPNLVQNKNLLVDRLNFVLSGVKKAYQEFMNVS